MGRPGPGGRETWRSFIATPVPVETTAALGALLEPLHLPAAARWMRGASIHVTLVFLGGIRPGAVPPLADVLRETAARHQPIEITLGHAGSFGGGGRPRVAWIGLDDGVDELRTLAADLESRVWEAVAGPRMPVPAFRPSRRLTPHLTVARRAGSDLVSAIDKTLAAAPPVRWTAERIVLYRSHLGVGPPLHEELAATDLGARFADLGTRPAFDHAQPPAVDPLSPVAERGSPASGLDRVAERSALDPR